MINDAQFLIVMNSFFIFIIVWTVLSYSERKSKLLPSPENKEVESKDADNS